MKTLDFKKERKDLYTAKPEPKIVTVPPLQYVSIAGEGDPNTSDTFSNAVSALYSVVYKMKFMLKKGETAFEAIDYKVMPMEGQWWADDMANFVTLPKSEWKWKVMILVPEFVNQALFEEVRNIVAKKKPSDALALLELETIEDGISAQLMHIGPYSEEAATIQNLHAFIFEQGYTLTGLHREIYLGDPRKGDQSKLKTIIRQPMRN